MDVLPVWCRPLASLVASHLLWTLLLVTRKSDARDQLASCNNVVKVGIYPSPDLTFTAPTNDPELRSRLVNTALAVLDLRDACRLSLILLFKASLELQVGADYRRKLQGRTWPCERHRG